MPDLDLTLDHQRLDDTRATRRYFGKFARITSHLAQVAAEEQKKQGQKRQKRDWKWTRLLLTLLEF